MRPWDPAPPPFWKTSALWAGIYLFVMLYAVVRETWGKDEAARRPILRRVLLAAGVLCLCLHLLAAWQLIAELNGLSVLGPRLTPGDQARVVVDFLFFSAAAWALLAATVTAAVIFWRPPRSGGPVPWIGIALAAIAVAVGALFPLEGRRWPPGLLYAEPAPAPTWIERACLLGGLLIVPAMVVIAFVGISNAVGKGPAHDARRESYRLDLALWGFLLFVGAVLVLEWGAMSHMEMAAIWGPRFGGWGPHIHAFVLAYVVPEVLASLGLLALWFGVVRRRPHRVDRGADTPPPEPADA